MRLSRSREAPEPSGRIVATRAGRWAGAPAQRPRRRVRRRRADRCLPPQTAQEGYSSRARSWYPEARPSRSHERARCPGAAEGVQLQQHGRRLPEVGLHGSGMISIISAPNGLPIGAYQFKAGPDEPGASQISQKVQKGCSHSPRGTTQLPAPTGLVPHDSWGITAVAAGRPATSRRRRSVSPAHGRGGWVKGGRRPVRRTAQRP
jgi:hypothetical protein